MTFSNADQKEAFKKFVGTQTTNSIIASKRFSRFLYSKQNIL